MYKEENPLEGKFFSSFRKNGDISSDNWETSLPGNFLAYILENLSFFDSLPHIHIYIYLCTHSIYIVNECMCL